MCSGVRLKRCVAGVCDTLIEAEEKLNELDSGSGDADCGTTLKAGATGNFVYTN